MNFGIILYIAPAIHVTVIVASDSAMVGSMYSLTCTITGAERLTDAVVTYQWRKNGTVVSDQQMATLSFSSLIISDAGNYTCQATVTSILLSNPIINTSSSSVVLACKI